MTASIGYRVADEIQAETGCDTRVTVLGYLQRGGIPSGYDRILATRFGAAAAEYAAAGQYGIVTALQRGSIRPIPLHAVAGKIKQVPENHPMIQSARDIGVCLGD